MSNARIFTLWSLVTIFSFSLFSCEESNTIGLNLQPDQLQVTTSYVDTIELEVGSIWFDSIPTFNVTRLLVGRVESPEFGTVKATSYAEAILPTEDSADIFNGATTLIDVGRDSIWYDSLTMNLVYNYTDGDVDLSATQKFFVHELSTDIDTVNAREWYSFNSIPKGNLLAELDYQPTDSTTSIDFKLPDALGEDLYNELLNQRVNSSEDLQNIIKGFVFSTDDNGQAMYGINVLTTLTRFRVHYHYVQDGDTLNRTYQMLLGNRFHQIEVDRTGSPLASLAKNTLLSSESTNNIAYLQAGTGLYTYVKIPDDITTFSLANKRAINRVEFLMRPIDNSVTDASAPPASLELILADANRRISTDENGLAVIVTDDVSRTTIEYNNNGQGYFPYAFTNYIEDLANERDSNTGFFISPESFTNTNNALYNTTTSRLQLGDRNYTGLLPMQIRLYYTEFK